MVFEEEAFLVGGGVIIFLDSLFHFSDLERLYAIVGLPW